MHKMRNVFYRYRLMTSVLTLVLLLGVLAVSPAQADIEMEQGWDMCSTGCTNWNQQDGCVYCQHCCVKKSGEYSCWEIQPNACA